MKMGQAHVVPLSRQVTRLLQKLRALKNGGEYLFPALHTSVRPMCENTLNVALRRLGYVSFIGRTLIERGHKPQEIEDAWKRFDKNNTRDKIKVIRRLTGATINWNKRPYASGSDLINLRHQFVYPKAHRPEQREFEAVGTEDELKAMLREYRPEYERQLTWEFVKMAYDDVEAIWSDLLAAAKIEAHETWSGGMQGLEFIEHVDDEDL